MNEPSDHPQNNTLLPLMLGAIGVVFGDIGTSPLYAVKEALGGAHSAVPTHDNVMGVISLIFWTLMVVLTIKYQFFVMRADNQGEGGNLALVALAKRFAEGSPRLQKMILVIGMCGVALFFGDGMITPALSVLSAVEGLEVGTSAFKPYILPITLTVLVILFLFQSKGTGKVGAFFGPILILWFLAIGAIGLANILQQPEIILALNPLYGFNFLFSEAGGDTFMVLGSVFLAVTGAEALYADMGHFGRRAINWSWISFVYPALTLNYLGQGALILGDQSAAQNPFYMAIPSWGLYPMVALATAATVIASQAVISGAFSATQQAIQLGYLPRLKIIHTSARVIGQIYVPATNWLLLIGVVALVLGFRTSDNMAAAYGIAVTGTMVAVTALAFGIVLRRMLNWGWSKSLVLLALFLAVDLGFFSTNILKVADGGWFPLLLGAVIFFVMSTWQLGQELVHKVIRKRDIPLHPFLRQFEANPIHRIPGTAIYMSSNSDVAPPALVQMLMHTWTLHERVILLHLTTLDIPYVAESERMEVEPIYNDFFSIKMRFGFMENPDVPKVLAQCSLAGEEGISLVDSYFFMGRASFVASRQTKMAAWRLQLFLALVRMSESAFVYFNIPADRVVDFGSRIILTDADSSHPEGLAEEPEIIGGETDMGMVGKVYLKA